MPGCIKNCESLRGSLFEGVLNQGVMVRLYLSCKLHHDFSHVVYLTILTILGKLRKVVGGVHNQIYQQKDFPQTKFANKENFLHVLSAICQIKEMSFNVN